MVTGVARADSLFNESFTGATATQPGFSVGSTGTGSTVFKQVCLTASTNTSQTPIPGCTAGQPAIPAGGDPAGSGALRFTDNEGNLAGFLLSATQLPLTAGLDVSFDYYSYDKTSGSPADGLSFFLVNGTTTLTSPGAVGGSLGYAQGSGVAGVANGYLGVGLDEYGNYTNNSQGKGAGCTGEPLSSGLAPNVVGVRGPGNGLTGYCLLAKSATLNPGLAVGSAKSRTAAGVEQAVEIKVDPPSAPNPMVTVLINGTQVLQTAEPPNPPPTFKFGFAASTGGSNDIHEIQNVSINTINTLPKLTLSNTPSATPTAGGPLTYTLQGTTDPTAGTEAQPITITDTLPAGVTVSSLPTGSGWDCSATVVGSAAVSCTYTPSSALAPGTALPPLSVPTTVAPDARGPLTATATIASTDNANSAATSSAAATVTPTATVNTSVAVTAPASIDINTPGTFTVTAANAGPSTATVTTVTVPVPAGATFDSGPAGCAVSGGSVVCAVGTLAPGASVALPLTFTPSLAGGLELDATVTQSESDSDTADNAASATAPIISPAPPPLPAPPAATPTTRTADLAMTVTGPATAPAAGEPVAFTLAVANHGPDDDTGVTVSAPLPSGATIVSLSPACTVVSETIVCVAGNLANGDSSTFEVVVQPAGGGPLALTGTATGDLPDESPADNVDSAETTVSAPPPATTVDLGVKASSSTQAGATTIAVTVTNDGSSTATGVSVDVPLPSGAGPATTPPRCTLDGTVEVCTIGTLAAHHSAHLTIGVHLRGKGRQGTSATVRSTQADSNPSNNHVTVTVTAPRAKRRAPAKPAKPRLSLTASFNRGSVLSHGTVTLTVRVRTTNHTTARHARVCERLPAGLAVVSAGHAAVHGRDLCLTLRSVGSHARTLRITLRAASVAHTTVVHAAGRATARHARAVTAATRLVLVPLPPPQFTG